MGVSSPRHRVVGGRYPLRHALGPRLVARKRLPDKLEGLRFPGGDG